MAPLALCALYAGSGEDADRAAGELEDALGRAGIAVHASARAVVVALGSGDALLALAEAFELRKPTIASGGLAPFRWTARRAFAPAPEPAADAVLDEAFAGDAGDAKLFAHYEQMIVLVRAVEASPVYEKLRRDGTIVRGPVALHDARTAAHVLRLLTSGSGVQSGESEEAALDACANYFGLRVSLYFAVLRHYTRFLFVPAAVGLGYVVAGCDITTADASASTAFFALAAANVVWAATFAQCLPRRVNELLSRWGYNDHARQELDQTPQRGDGTKERVSEVELALRTTAAWGAVALSLVLVVAPVAFFIFALVYAATTGEAGRFYRMLTGAERVPGGMEPGAYVARRLYETSWLGMHRSDRFEDTTCALGVYGTCYMSVSEAALYAVVTLQAQVVVQLNTLGARLAHRVSSFERHRSPSHAAASAATKALTFYFLNAFAGPFYYAFVLRDFALLRKYLSARLITAQITGTLTEMLTPYITYQVSRAFSKGTKLARSTTIAHGTHGHASVEAAIAEAEALRPSSKQALQPRYESVVGATKDDSEGGVFDDMLELALQFSNCVLFLPVYPLAAVFAFVNNIVEVRSDGFRLCRLLRYPDHVLFGPQGAMAWVSCFQAVSWLSVLVNSGLLLVFVMQAPKVGLGAILGTVGFEHVLAVACVALASVVPTTPEAVVRRDLKRTFAADDTASAAMAGLGNHAEDATAAARHKGFKEEWRNAMLIGRSSFGRLLVNRTPSPSKSNGSVSKKTA